jgi:hypothetical protein
MTRRQAQLIVAGHVFREISHRCRRAQNQGLLKGLIFVLFIEEVERVFCAVRRQEKKKALTTPYATAVTNCRYIQPLFLGVPTLRDADLS